MNPFVSLINTINLELIKSQLKKNDFKRKN